MTIMRILLLEATKNERIKAYEYHDLDYKMEWIQAMMNAFHCKMDPFHDSEISIVSTFIGFSKL